MCLPEIAVANQMKLRQLQRALRIAIAFTCSAVILEGRGYVHLYVAKELDLYEKVALMVNISMYLHDVYISIEFGSMRTFHQGYICLTPISFKKVYVKKQ